MKARLRRRMPEAQWVAPSRPTPKAENPHAGTILTEQPTGVWASDDTMTATIPEGPVKVFVAVDDRTKEYVRIHATKKATRFEAQEPIRQGGATNKVDSAPGLLPVPTPEVIGKMVGPCGLEPQTSTVSR